MSIVNLRCVILLAVLFLPSWQAGAQQCASGEVLSHNAYLYGRFETRMQSVAGDGVVSSFFLYNIDLACNWPAENNEIDVEMTGNQLGSVQFTTHYPGPWGATQIVGMPFNPHEGLHDYAIEWEPGVVRWFVDGSLVYTQDAPFVQGLIYPMRIMMNLWAVDSPDWTGIFDPSVMPAASRYDYVKYYEYTPGAGNAGTGNNFSWRWTDHFEHFNTNRWSASEFKTFGDIHCTFVSPNVTVANSELKLTMTEPQATTFTIVKFQVDARSAGLGPNDTVYLNGTFNNWCGACNPMSDADGDGIWERTVNLPAGRHEFLFTRNVWQELAGAPLGSDCDFSPCDEYGNYGITVKHGAAAITTPAYRWGSCDTAQSAVAACPIKSVGQSVSMCPLTGVDPADFAYFSTGRR